MRRGEKFSVRESSAVISLLVTIILVQLAQFFITHREETAEQKEEAVDARNLSKTEHNLFCFDPNSIGLEELISLGLTQGQAQVLINYRAKGGYFFKPEDLQKVYSLPKGFYDRVKEYIVIKERESNPGYIQKGSSSKSDPKDSFVKSKPPKSVVNNQQPKDSATTQSFTIKQTDILVELNSADSIHLIKVPGIGPYFAASIIKLRESRGGVAHLDQLMEIKGMDSLKLAKMLPYLTVDTNKIEKRDLSNLSLGELASHPYIGPYLARAIENLKTKGINESINLALLITRKLITPDRFKLMRHYFR